MINKFKRLIRNPSKEYKNIFSMIKRDSRNLSKVILDFIGIDYFSRPYPNHDKLLKHLNNKKNGFFVECGGYDGYFQDPSYNLEKFKGWTGVIIEPLPLMYELCKKNRPKSEVYSYAAGSKLAHNTKLKILNVGPMSIIKDAALDYEGWAAGAEKILGIKRQELTVTSLTLDSILDGHFTKFGEGEIDLLIIDVEGFELDVLDGFSVEKYLPHFILIEIIDLKRKPPIDELLQKFYVLKEGFNNYDYLYELKAEYQ